MHRRNFITLITATIGLRPLAGATPVAATTSPSPLQGQPVPALPSDPVESHPSLEAWLRLPIQPVWDLPPPPVIYDTPDAVAHVLLTCIRNGESLEIEYFGGSDPDRRRSITPALLFRKPADRPDPPLYLLAWCHTRRQLRSFRVDRIAWPEPFPPVLP